ncbi:ferrochelatase, mitochondrial isoform X2 [Nomia melanderi]|uniref:ferrochelatase, mitochondrial isoform X2 n=1 Tax=Nomia melanderi TaxID=2448451 RepID=UPI003FCE1CBD
MITSYMQLPLNMKWSIIDRWATHPLFIKTIAERIKEELVQFPMEIRHDVIILFSAHSLPLKAVNRGDSYPSEIGATVALVMQELNYCNPYNLVWQSKVGPLPWLAPFTDDALRAYVKQGKKNFILVPVAFVNEHIETLHEMDIEYCTDLAKELGIEKIRRASAPNDHPMFIDALTDIVLSHLKSKRSINPKFLTRCPHCVNKTCLSSKNWYAKTCTS